MCKASKDFGQKKIRNNTVVVKNGIPIVSESCRYTHFNGKSTKKSFRQRINTPSLR